MVTGAVARVVRQQGQRRLLAWRGALAELQPQGPEPQQQGAAGAAAGAAAAQQQQCCGLRSLAPSAPSCSVSFAAAAGVPAWQPSLLLQSRGMALNFSRYQPRKKQEQRQLPERNLEIKAAQVRVLFPEGDERPSEVMQLKRAVKLAKAEGMDVVMISPKADPPVVRVTEWSKVLYDLQKREKTAMKQRLAQQRASEPKEVRVGCQIAEHDLAVKMGQARRFLEDGNMLRLVVTFKGGAQIALGRDVVLYLIGQLSEMCTVKDEKHLQRPQRGQWAVLLAPLEEKVEKVVPAGKAPAPARKPQLTAAGEGEGGLGAAAAGEPAAPVAATVA